MREEMASSSSLCVCECAFADHSLDHNRPRSLQKEQIVPLSPSLRVFLSLSLCDGRPVIFHHYLGTLKKTSHPK